MTDPYFSIVVPTMRVGGLDVLFAGLAAQTFRSFELVLVDDLKLWRIETGSWSWTMKCALQSGFGLQHLEPVGNDFPRNHYCRSANTGIREARGEVVLLLVDYTWLPPRFLELHHRLHEERHDRVVLGPHRSVRCPAADPRVAFRPNLDHYTSAGLDDYLAALALGRLDDLGWSIFEHKFKTPEGLPPEDRFGSDPKSAMPPGPIENVELFFCRGESVKREHLLRINGFDEALDGSHAYQDSDVAHRLRRLGLEFWNAPEEVAVIVNPRPLFPHARRDRPIESNRDYFEARKAAGFPGVVRGISDLT